MWKLQIRHNAEPTGPVKYWLARAWLTLLGWKVIGELPPDSKFVMVGGPHTSNWDFVIGVPALYVIRLKACWMGKDALFRWPMGPIMRALGGIAIDRSSPHGVVRQTVNRLRTADRLVVLIPAKGTRGRREYWKSGFYHIAREAGVRVVCSYLDYSTRTACLGHSFIPSGDIKKDMDAVRRFYDGVRGRHVELEDTIRLREEDK